MWTLHVLPVFACASSNRHVLIIQVWLIAVWLMTSTGRIVPLAQGRRGGGSSLPTTPMTSERYYKNGWTLRNFNSHITFLLGFTM